MRTVVVALGLTIAAATAHAQVNAESLRPGPSRAGWSGGLEGSFALYRGNVELLDVGGGGRVQYQTLHPQAPPAGGQPPPPFVAQRTFLTANGRFADRAGTRFVSQAFAHLRWTAMWLERFGTDVFAQGQYNEFLRLQARGILGGGVRVDLVHERAVLVWAGSGPMLEHNRIDVLPGAPDDPTTLDVRWTSYAAIRISLLGDALLLQNTVYLQPRVDDLGDFRLLEEPEVLAVVQDRLAFGATLSVVHDSAPPTGVDETDVRLLSTVRISF